MKNEEIGRWIIYGILGALILHVLADTWFVITGVLTFIGAITVHEYYKHHKDQ